MTKTCDTCGGEIVEWMKEHEPSDCIEKLLLQKRKLLNIVNILRGAVEDVEYISHWCAWCGEVTPEHKYDCVRQIALNKAVFADILAPPMTPGEEP
jgi:hypothetical protein